ncbi:MAG: MCE family protein [Flavobacteriales bacterium]|nr:MCE family protein [Flavobacteriales bacterium]
MKVSKEFKAGLIVVSTLLAFWFVFQFLKGRNLLTSENVFYVMYNEVSGLEKTKPVTISGLRVGIIKDIEPVLEQGKELTFKVTLQVDEKYPVYKNSIAEIYEPGMLSGKEIRIVYPKDKILAQSGEYLQGRLKSSLTSVLANEVEPLRDNLNKTLIDLDSTLVTATKTLGSVNGLLDKQTTQNIKTLISNLNTTVVSYKQTAEELNQFLAENNSKVSTLLESGNQAMITTNTTVEKYGKVADKINELELQKTFASLEKTSASLNELLAKLNSNQGSAGKFINDAELYDNLTSTTNSLDLLLKDFKESPKRYVHFSIFGGGKDKKEKKSEDLKP